MEKSENEVKFVRIMRKLLKDFSLSFEMIVKYFTSNIFSSKFIPKITGKLHKI